MWKIADIEIENQIVIAPMAGVSNMAFRMIAKQFGAGLIYTEMISDKGICYDSIRTKDMTIIDKSEHPISMQLFGSDVDSMVMAAIYLDEHSDCDIIDINFGCPVRKIVTNGGGSELLKTPEKIYDIVSNVVKAVKKPVTVKIRIGWDLDSINCVQVAQLIEKAGASAIAVHGRTRSQMYTGKADWSYIKQVKDAVSIPVIGNGDVTSVEMFKQMLEETNCDAVMIGRGVLGDPWLIRQCNDYLNNQDSKEITVREKFDLALKHAASLIELKGEKIAMREMRGHAMWYIQGIPYSAKVKPLMIKVHSYNDLEAVLNKYMDALEKDDFRFIQQINS